MSDTGIQSDLHMKVEVIKKLQTCFDPEIPVNIYDLGLIYEVNIDDENNVQILMTLTTPACPVAGTLPGEVEALVAELQEVKSVVVELVWDPPWNPEMMSEAAKLELNMF